MSTAEFLESNIAITATNDPQTYDTCLLPEVTLTSLADDTIVNPRSTPTFALQWATVAGADFYILQLGNDQDFRGATTFGFKVTDTFKLFNSLGWTSLGDILPNVEYYWRVYAYSEGLTHCSSPVSETWSFTVVPPVFDNDDDDGIVCDDIEIRDYRLVEPPAAVGNNSIIWDLNLNGGDGGYEDARVKLQYSHQSALGSNPTRGFAITDFGPFGVGDFSLQTVVGTSKSVKIIPNNNSNGIKESGSITVTFSIAIPPPAGGSGGPTTCESDIVINYTFVDESSSSSSSQDSSSSSAATSSSSEGCALFNGECEICEETIEFKDGIAYLCTSGG